jgi:zinc transport system ATP-binding protein
VKAIEINDLSFSYDKTDVLQNINFTINTKEFIAIIGPNGGGKSTLLKLILGLLEPRKGNILIHNKPSKSFREQIGYMPQQFIQNKTFPITIAQIVMSGLINKKNIFFSYSKDEKQKALNALDMVGLKDFSDKKINMLSGGQIQRVFLARAIVCDPKILILDEPTSNIDPQGEYEIFKLLKEFNKTMTVIVVSHDLSMLMDFATKAIFINKTAIVHEKLNITKEQVSKSLNLKNSHICEVELLNYLSKHKNL